MSELYKLPEGWEWKKLGDLAEYVNGMAFKPTDFSDTGYPIIRIQNLNGKTNYNYFNGEAKEKYYVKDGDILISWSASLDVYKWDGGDAILNQHIFNTNINLDTVNYDFFYHTIKYSLAEIMKNLHGVGMKHITKGKFENIDIPLPPLQEQKRIVAKLDTLFQMIDKAIALHQKNMDEADVFMGSVLNEIFGELNGQYGKRTLESFNRKMSSGGTPSRKEKAYWENGIIDWFSSGELNQLYTLPAKEKITQLGLDKTSTKLFSKGTLLIGMYDTAAMKMSILSTDGSCNQAIVGFKPDENELDIFFIKYQLEYLKKEILKQRQGVRQQNLNLRKIKNIKIEYPPLNIQQKTVTYLDKISQKIEKLKAVQKEKMQSLVALKASILDQAFRGEL